MLVTGRFRARLDRNGAPGGDLVLKTARGSLERSEVSDHDLVFGNYTGGFALLSNFNSVINASTPPD